MTYVKDKYKDEAALYDSNVSAFKSSLEAANSSLNKVESMLGLDPKNAKDILTYNVIIGNQEIKEELKGIAEDLDSYVGLVEAKAIEIDNKLAEEERRRLELLEKNNDNDEEEEEETSE